MISRAQDYQYITPVGMVNGDILPARDNEADGSSLVLCAEDLDFALEAVGERNLSDSPTAIIDTVTPSLILQRRDWNGVWANLRRVAFTGNNTSPYLPRAVSYGETFPAQPYTSTAPSGLESWYPGVYMTSCYHADVTSSVLAPTAMWRGLYYDLKRADRLDLTVGLGNWSNTGYDGTWQCAVNDGSSSQTVTGTLSGSNQPHSSSYYICYISYTNSTPMERYVRHRSSALGTMTCAVPRFDRVNIYGAVIVASYHLFGYGFESTSTIPNRKDFYFTRSWNCTISNGNVIIPADIWLPNFDIVTEAGNLGITLPASGNRPTGASTWWIPYAILEFQKCYLIVLYDFHTEIRSLNWQWTP